MSSRVLKKLGLQGEKDITFLPEDGSDAEGDLSHSSGARKKQLNLNRYDVLNEQSHSESEVKEDDDHETTSSLTNNDLGQVETKEISRKKKKKKKRKAHRVPANARSSEDNAEDEVERSVREVNEMLGEIEPSFSDPKVVVCRSKDILSIEQRNLNPNNELKRIFGSKIVQQTEMKKRGRVRGHMKTTWFVTPKNNWPSIGKPGIEMKLVSSSNGINVYQYIHHPQYQQVQMKFLDAVDSGNPDNIVKIIDNHPYHVDALLQLSEFCRLSEDFSMSSEFLERALFILESFFHPSFASTSASSRLEYDLQENRALFIALFKHLTLVGQRACYRTALELSKFLLSLDPVNDPLAITLSIDFYAIRAQQYSWFLSAADQWTVTRNINQLPNFSYGTAIAHFLLTGGKDVEKANECLQRALILFPGVLFPLLEKCGIQPDSKVMGHSFFNQQTTSTSLKQLEALYVTRCHHIWRDPDLLAWLESNAHAVLGRVDEEDSEVGDLRSKVETWYKAATPRNILRHLILSDLKEVPINLLDCHGPLYSFDPLPPPGGTTIYHRPNRPTLNMENANAFSAFFRSLMPNYDINEPAGQAIARDVELGTNVTELTQSVTSFLGALRDYLSDFHSQIDIDIGLDTDDDTEVESG